LFIYLRVTIVFPWIPLNPHFTQTIPISFLLISGFRFMTSSSRIICVGTVTRNRPIMLLALLNSYAAMQTPDDTQLQFVVVENNADPTITEIIERFRKSVPDCPVQYETEPRLGISFARNRVLNIAIANGCDLLTFADDDETVQPDWLVQLLAERDLGDFDIVGGPVRMAPSINAARWNRMIWNALNKHLLCHEMASRAIRKGEKAGELRIATGNWLGNLGFFRKSQLRFDENFGLNGGEDWWLYHDAKKMGAKTSWAPYAIAYETVPTERLTLSYYFKRSRNHCTIETRIKFHKRRLKMLWRLPASIIARLLKLLVQLGMLPFTPGSSLVKIANYLGSIVGILQAFTPFHSPHYRKTTGY
jgi:glycosyltransferase involved in cell wall biosynthesis